MKQAVRAMPFICGQKVILRGLEKEDVRGSWFNWFNNSEVTKYMERGIYPNTREGLTEFYHRVAHGNTSDLVLAIIWKNNGKHIGNIGLHKIDPVHRKAEFGIVIGEKNYWGRGAGQEATSLITRHGFDKLNLHKIYLGVRSDHKAGIQAYSRAGFRKEGLLKEELYRDGRYHDVLWMSMLNPKHK